MSKALLTGLALAAFSLLAGCVDLGDIPNTGGQSAYQRGIDQDLSATHESGGPQIRYESPSSRVNWRRLDDY
jgi:hypothetical protein